MKLIPYKFSSASAKLLAEGLGIKRMRLEGAPHDFKRSVLINWGCSGFTREFANVRVLNRPEAVAVAINKLSAFNAMDANDVSIPYYTQSKEAAAALIRDGRKVVCRTKLSAYGGDGIVIAETEDQLVDAPLYVRYYPKQEEYRVHATATQVFFKQRKARRLEVADDDVNWQVRNLAGGFIYANVDVQVPPKVEEAAKQAIQALGLDFGAVDILLTPRGHVVVLEVNTACGLSGTTLTRYVEMLQGLSQ